MKKSKGFTLIELIVVLVILALIALIVTPLIMRVLDKAEDSANKRSVDGYGKSIEVAIANYLLDKGEYPTNVDDLTIEYTGSEVDCKTRVINADGSVFLTRCYVEDIKVKDKKTDDGWYHYGKTNMNQNQSYKIGDIVEYNGMKFYVIINSSTSDDTVTLLKDLPLTVADVNKYSNGVFNLTENESENGYGLVNYSDSSSCEGWKTYGDSKIKPIVDAWASDVIGNENLGVDSLGYKTRLLTMDDLFSRLGYENVFFCSGGCGYRGTKDFVPTWVYSSNYSYWVIRDPKYLWEMIDSGGNLYGDYCDNGNFAVIRPVITLNKSSIKEVD